jgi:hypothetical protein
MLLNIGLFALAAVIGILWWSRRSANRKARPNR